MRGGQIAEFAVGVDDWAFVGGDGVGSVLERGADVIDGGLSGLDVEGRGFEEDVSLGGLKPGADGCRLLIRCPAFIGQECPIHTCFRIQAVGVGNPSQAEGCDSGDAERNSVALAQFLFAVAQELHEGAVDIAEAEEAEVVGANERPLTRLRMPAPKAHRKILLFRHA